MSTIAIVYVLVILIAVYITTHSMIKAYRIFHKKRAYIRLTILIILQVLLILLLLLSAYDMVIQELGYPERRILIGKYLYEGWCTITCWFTSL